MLDHFTSNTESVLFWALNKFSNPLTYHRRPDCRDNFFFTLSAHFLKRFLLGEQRKGCQCAGERTLIGSGKKSRVELVTGGAGESVLRWTQPRFSSPVRQASPAPCSSLLQPAPACSVSYADSWPEKTAKNRLKVSGFLALQCLGFQSCKDKHRVQENCIKCETFQTWILISYKPEQNIGEFQQETREDNADK